MGQSALRTIRSAELAQVISEGAEPRILDVRTAGEFRSVHIPDSHNVPLDAIDRHLADLAGGDRPIVVVCQSGARADQACRRLVSAGTSSVALLEGGIQSWRASGGDVVVGTSGTWAMDRQVRLVAGSLVLIGILLSIFVPGAKWFAAAIGFGLFFSAVTNTCAMGTMLSKLPYNRANESGSDDVAQAVAALTAT